MESWSHSDDGVIKAIRHRNRPVVGIMWHPERYTRPRISDQKLFYSLFGR